MHGKLNAYSDGTTPWTTDDWLYDVVQMHIGNFDTTTYKLLTTDTATGSDGGIVSTVEPGWELVDYRGPESENLPSHPIAATSFACLKGKFLGSGADKYMAFYASADYIFVQVGNFLEGDDPALVRSYVFPESVRYTPTSQAILLNSSIRADVVDFSFKITPAGFAMAVLSASGYRLAVIELSGHPSHENPQLCPMLSLKSSDCFLQQGAVAGLDYEGTITTATPSIEVGGTIESYFYAGKAGATDKTGTYRILYWPIAFRYRQNWYGEIHPSMGIYAVARSGAPGGAVQAGRVIQDGDTYEIWDYSSNQPNAQATYPWYVKVE